MQNIRMHETIVIGSVIIDVYRLVDKTKNEKNCDANIKEKGTVAWTGEGYVSLAKNNVTNTA